MVLLEVQQANGEKLWDVCSDQEAVDLVRGIQDPQAASRALVEHALARFSTDNLSCMVVRFDNKALKQRKTEAQLGVDRDPPGTKPGISEADAIVAQARKEVGEPEQSMDSAAKEVIKEEENENEESGPELNAAAVMAARKNPG